MTLPKKPLIENGFPFGEISLIAEHESWRKEIYRPSSYIHKWWARRLGSVFRGLLIAGLEDSEAVFFENYYGNNDYQEKVIFDPFMGSGTIVHEAIKLGATAIGSDINPVAATIVRAAVDDYKIDDVINEFERIKEQCEENIKHYYRSEYNNEVVDVLYYFWVKTIDCDGCGSKIPLTKTTIFSKNAYPSKKPESKSCCPVCGHINTVLYNDEDAICGKCHNRYNPQEGNVKGIEYVCPTCGKHEKIVDYYRRKQIRPEETLFAKIVVDSAGKKHYLEVTEQDKQLYNEASNELEKYKYLLPNERIIAGINTNQVLNYQYSHWIDMFNERQLLAFALLAKEINAIEDIRLRRLFAVLFSGTLEFNNMFCSFKGEGTGAVRPLFYNHILKNELSPLEANPWGCQSSSGSFSTLFETRIMRMLKYKESPFEIKVVPGEKPAKVFVETDGKHPRVVDKEEDIKQGNVAILCKDSSRVGLNDKSVDMVVTDPPFFDNVNYSELADFFFVWLKRFNVGMGFESLNSTRNEGEVQDNQPEKFSNKLCDVFCECHRVLKDEGLLVFTYHHSRIEGWISVFNAIVNAGFSVSQVFPVKAEMSVSVAINAAKEPINYDLVFVCRKTPELEQLRLTPDIQKNYYDGIRMLEKQNLKLSDGDKKIYKYGLAIKALSSIGAQSISNSDLEMIVSKIG